MIERIKIEVTLEAHSTRPCEPAALVTELCPVQKTLAEGVQIFDPASFET